jgi:hypothetical protein
MFYNGNKANCITQKLIMPFQLKTSLVSHTLMNEMLHTSIKKSINK